MFWLKFHESVSFSHKIVLSVVPFRVMPPPSAVESVGLATDPISMFLSSTVRVVLLMVVVVPLTVRLPVITTLPVNVPPVAGTVSFSPSAILPERFSASLCLR